MWLVRPLQGPCWAVGVLFGVAEQGVSGSFDVFALIFTGVFGKFASDHLAGFAVIGDYGLGSLPELGGPFCIGVKWVARQVRLVPRSPVLDEVNLVGDQRFYRFFVFFDRGRHTGLVLCDEAVRLQRDKRFEVLLLDSI